MTGSENNIDNHRQIIGSNQELDNAYKNLQQQLSELRQTEKALQESEARYRSLVENANEAIIVVQDGFIRYANPMALQTFDCSAAEITATPAIDFVHPDDREHILVRNKKRLKGENVENPINFRLLTTNGTIKTITNSSVRIQWDGRPADLVLMTDITEVKKMEDEILRADKLESIGLLAGGIAHDFNNYLATLLGNISLAKLYKDDGEKVLEKMENMEKTILRARELSGQLFTFAKGGSPLKEKLDLGQLIMEKIKFTLSGSNVCAKYSIAADLYPVEADGEQLGQVLNNIVVNAVQSMPEGGIMEVHAENFSVAAKDTGSTMPLPEGSYVKVTIKDEGTGIPAKYLSKIFDPFFTTKDKGRGLGLAIAYSIIKKHGGQLSVESKMGEGSSFFIFLPTAVRHGEEQALTDKLLQGTGKILVMDDEEELLTVTGETLTALGYDVIPARDGREAIELYMRARENNEPFDLVILDLTVPGGMGGKQTISALLEKDPGARVIVASGYADDPVMANFQDYGFKGAVQKPFTIGVLAETVHNMLMDKP